VIQRWQSGLETGSALLPPVRMTFDPVLLLLALIPSGAGFVLFVYGKKQERWPHLVAGLLLMVYPYFATSVAWLVAAGATIGCVLWYLVRQGW